MHGMLVMPQFSPQSQTHREMNEDHVNPFVAHPVILGMTCAHEQGEWRKLFTYSPFNWRLIRVYVPLSCFYFGGDGVGTLLIPRRACQILCTSSCVLPTGFVWKVNLWPATVNYLFSICFANTFWNRMLDDSSGTTAKLAYSYLTVCLFIHAYVN